MRVAVPPPRTVRSAAIDFLLDAYDGVPVQPGKGLPHAQAVADILREAGADEQTQVAGLLHDVIEDTPRGIDEVRSVFGDKLAAMVGALAEDARIDRYEQRKRMLRSRIAAAPQPGVLDVALADKIATLRHAGMTGTAISHRKLSALPGHAAARAWRRRRFAAHRGAQAPVGRHECLAVAGSTKR